MVEEVSVLGMFLGVTDARQYLAGYESLQRGLEKPSQEGCKLKITWKWKLPFNHINIYEVITVFHLLFDTPKTIQLQ